MKIKENSAVKKIIKMPVGYTILTISDNYDLKRIAIKGSISKGRRYIYMYDKDTDLVNSIDAEVKVSNENGLKIVAYGDYIIHDAEYVLLDCKKKILNDNRMFKSIEDRVKVEEQSKNNLEIERITKQKDKEIADLQQKLKERENYYTVDRLTRLSDIKKDLVLGEVTCYSYSSGMRDRGRYFGGYQMTSTSNVTKKVKNNGIKFVIEKLEIISELYNSDAFSNNRLHTLLEKIESLETKARTKYDEETLNSIQSIYGLIAEELTIRLINLCNHIRNNNIKTDELTYEETIYRYGTKFYDDESEYEEIEKIDNYFDSIIEGACTFIERITNQNIKDELLSRLHQEIEKPKEKRIG